ncbi:protein trichome birefringence-like 10 [Panicum miliaceum]|uniref:Protein trichome birefringence-like 10 n=1 Tax=Panicum miliaceum TaxID=4540 RepID=A0A3L6T765_PANMI|nr:protein trichome birefringence-like 10 [Panicum miliaceum]
MVLGSPVKRLARQAAKGPLERVSLAGITAAAAHDCCSASSRSAARLLRWRPRPGRVSIAAEAAQTRRKVATAGNEEECDLFDGEWVLADGGYPLYDSRDCPFLDVGFRCSENGRPDASYTK